MKKIKIKTTKKQKDAVDNILSGKFVTESGKPNIGKAMVAAGYSPSSGRIPHHDLAKRKGVQHYLSKLDKKSRKQWGMSLRSKVAEGYMEGIEADKYVGKDAMRVPDHAVRKSFLDQFAQFFNWIDASEKVQAKFSQYNFFSIDEKRRASLNQNFKDLLKRYYKDV